MLLSNQTINLVIELVLQKLALASSHPIEKHGLYGLVVITCWCFQSLELALARQCLQGYFISIYSLWCMVVPCLPQTVVTELPRWSPSPSSRRNHCTTCETTTTSYQGTISRHKFPKFIVQQGSDIDFGWLTSFGVTASKILKLSHVHITYHPGPIHANMLHSTS